MGASGGDDSGAGYGEDDEEAGAGADAVEEEIVTLFAAGEDAPYATQPLPSQLSSQQSSQQGNAPLLGGSGGDAGGTGSAAAAGAGGGTGVGAASAAASSQQQQQQQGLVQADCVCMPSSAECLIGAHAPHLIFSSSPSSPSASAQAGVGSAPASAGALPPPSYGVVLSVLRDFIGMEDADAATRKALLDFR